MIYLLTYDHPHRKTQDLLYHLKVAGVNLHVIATAWEERKNFKPLFTTKPEPYAYSPALISEKLGFKFDKIPLVDVVEVVTLHEGQFPQPPLPKLNLRGEVIIIAGAGILGKDFVKNNTVINAHCGWLPKVRGLDALKWAIYHNYPIGVTTHVVDEKCDAGFLIERREVSLYPQDTLYSIAMRQYEQEISMLVDAVRLERYLNTALFNEPADEPHRRMKHSTELVMMERLKERLQKLPMES